MGEETKSKQEGLVEIQGKTIPRSPIADSLEIEIEPLTADGLTIEIGDLKEETQKNISSSPSKEKSINSSPGDDSNDKSKIPSAGKVIEFAQAATLQKLIEISDKISTLDKNVSISKDEIAKVIEKFDTKIAADNHSREMFSAMHTELKSYKDAALFDIFHKPYLKDMVLVYDDLYRLQKNAESLKGKLKESDLEISKEFNNHANNIDNIKALLLESLNRMDVEIIEDKSDVIDKQYHKVVNTRKTSLPEEDGKIAEITNHGFRWKGKLLRHEEVIVFKQE
ncbi:MAG: nucleotide exchange factor GrpE [Verrucomicrobiota bacterium]|nr:nucleotide exchange factor GrpE [Verrucomicrobiota bacterium]